MRHAVLLAGGRGTRLESVSGGLPKPLMQVGGRPFIEHVLDNLVKAGCDHIVIAASYKWELLRDHLGSSYKGCALGWSIETQPLGTGGAIRQAFKLFDLAAAFVQNADTLFRVNLDALEKQHLAVWFDNGFECLNHASTSNTKERLKISLSRPHDGFYQYL